MFTVSAIYSFRHYIDLYVNGQHFLGPWKTFRLSQVRPTQIPPKTGFTYIEFTFFETHTNILLQIHYKYFFLFLQIFQSNQIPYEGVG